MYEDEMARRRVERPEYSGEDDEAFFNDIFSSGGDADDWAATQIIADCEFGRILQGESAPVREGFSSHQFEIIPEDTDLFDERERLLHVHRLQRFLVWRVLRIDTAHPSYFFIYRNLTLCKNGLAA